MRTQRDYYNVRTYEEVYALSDMAELAVRLGSPCSFDRRGAVIFIEDFEGSLVNWTPDYAGSGAGVVLSTLAYRSASHSCRLTSGPDVGDYAAIRRYYAWLGTGIVGFEVSYYYTGTFQRLAVSLEIHDGVDVYSPLLEVSQAANALRLFNNSSQWVTMVTGLTQTMLDMAWNSVKVVCDTDTGLYKRVHCNAYNQDHLTVTMPRSTAAAAYYGLLTIDCINTLGSAAIIYIDDVILTQED